MRQLNLGVWGRGRGRWRRWRRRREGGHRGEGVSWGYRGERGGREGGRRTTLSIISTRVVRHIRSSLAQRTTKQGAVYSTRGGQNLYNGGAKRLAHTDNSFLPLQHSLFLGVCEKKKSKQKKLENASVQVFFFLVLYYIIVFCFLTL